MTTNHNTVGLINCLRQPRQLDNQPLKSMREKLISFIKFLVPWLSLLPRQSQ